MNLKVGQKVMKIDADKMAEELSYEIEFSFFFGQDIRPIESKYKEYILTEMDIKMYKLNPHIFDMEIKLIK